MSSRWIIALDQGTSSSRALAMDERGCIVARSSCPVETLRPQKNWAEFDAEQLLQGQLSVLQQVLAQAEVQAAQPVALAIATQRSTIVFWDRQTGRPLMAAPGWQDGRAIQEATSAPIEQDFLHQLTGLYKTPFYAAPKIAWALKHVAFVAQAAQTGNLCIGPVASYLIWKLTDGKVFACDPTQAQRTLLFNIKTGDWDESLLRAFGVQRNWLPQIKNTVDNYGYYTYGKQQIPIRVCIGDQQAALYALQIEEEQTCINYGTGAFVMRHTGRQCRLLPGMLTSVGVSVDAQEKTYLLEGPVNACATVYTWLKSLGYQFSMQELDALCAQARDPVLCLPALSGLGAPYWDFKVAPVLQGVSPHSTVADVVAGATQGIAHLIADIIFYLEKEGISNVHIKVMGGLSQSHALLQYQANILQRDLVPCQEYESTCMGAALLAAKQLKWQTNDRQAAKYLPTVSAKITHAQAAADYHQWQQFVSACRRDVKE